VKTIASRGEGADELLAAIDEHRTWMVEHGELDQRRARRAEREISAIAVATLQSEIGELSGGEALRQFAEQVTAGELDPYTAADKLIAGVRRG
jgi:LAO/AO transport system kinase